MDRRTGAGFLFSGWAERRTPRRAMYAANGGSRGAPAPAHPGKDQPVA